MVVKVIFFDFDGTLVDSRGAAFRSMVRTLDEFNFKISKSKMLKHMGVKGELYFKKIGFNPAHIDEAHRRFWKIFRKKTISESGAHLCVSVKPLEDLSKSYPLVIVSNSWTGYLKRVLRKLKIRKLFRGVYGGDKFGTKDEMLEKLFLKMKIMPHEALYVGDRFSDIEFAREAGCYAVGINNGSAWSDLKTMKAEKPDFLIKDFYGLKKIIEALNMDYYG